MSPFQVAAILVALAAVSTYINCQFVHLPSKIGVMAITLVLSLIILAAGAFGAPIVKAEAGELLKGFNFSGFLLNGALAFLLFAAAMHLDLADLNRERAPVLLLATVGVVVSAVVIGGAIWLILHAVGIQAAFVRTLLFGALISPTDPIAVTGIMKTAHAPKGLEIQMGGESLLNDGVGVVVFLTLMRLEATGAGLSPIHVIALLVEEAIGGLMLGALAGFVVYLMLRRIDNYQVEIMLTLALAMGAYALAEPLPLSGPMAVVAAGLVIGNQGRSFAMSDETKSRLDSFWELIDSILNAVLFVLLGMEALMIPFNPFLIVAGAVAIPVTLIARWISVVVVQQVLRWTDPFDRNSVAILTCGGLRGGISVALALPVNPGRDPTIAMTYAVVVFSILVQGLTIGPLTSRLLRPLREFERLRNAEPAQ